MPDGQVVMAASRAPFADLKDEPRSSSRIRAVPSGQLKRCWGTSRTVACRRSVARHGPIRAVATRRARIPLVSGLFVLFYGRVVAARLLRCVVRNKEQLLRAMPLFYVGAGSACDDRARRGSAARPADDLSPLWCRPGRCGGVWVTQAPTMSLDGTDRRQSQLLRRRSGAQGAAIVSVGAGSACDHWARRGSAARPADDSQPALVPTGAAHWSMDEPSTDDAGRRDGSQAEPAPTKAQGCSGCGHCFCRSRLCLR